MEGLNLHRFVFKMETEAAARNHTRKRVPEAYRRVRRDTRKRVPGRSDNEGIRLKTNRY